MISNSENEIFFENTVKNNIKELQKQFVQGTIYAVFKVDTTENSLIFKEFIYCYDTAVFDENSKNSQFLFFGRTVYCDSIYYAPEKKSMWDWTCNNLFNKHVYEVYSNTSYNIVLQGIHNYIINTEDMDQNSSYKFFPIYKLDRVEQAYFIVEEDKYCKNKAKER